MSPRLFALIIGIDSYKSGDIWNLESCVHDAKRINRWLTNDLNVPQDQICILLENQAMKENIEDAFTRHFLKNPDIQPGDAILFYFAGHGSSLAAPPGWYPKSTSTEAVELLCTYDHDIKTPGGRVSGISDRAFHSLVDQLAVAKGTNITILLDCCFTPIQSRSNIRDRRITRWTPTIKGKATDLVRLPPATSASGGFLRPNSKYTVVVACGPGSKSLEGKNGGRFTYAFLRAVKHSSLHRLTYEQLVGRVNTHMSEGQVCVACGSDMSSNLFDGVPFIPDSRYVQLVRHDATSMRIEVGALHGVFKGGEVSVHEHNYGGSPNPSLANLVVLEVHPTWSKCTAPKTPPLLLGDSSAWGLVKRLTPRHGLRSRLSRPSLRKCQSLGTVDKTPAVRSESPVSMHYSDPEVENSVKSKNHRRANTTPSAVVQSRNLGQNVHSWISSAVHRFQSRAASAA